MALTPDLLRQVRLKSTSRDQALADKFIAIRNYSVPRNRPDARATITGEDIQVLQSLIARSSPTILVTNHVAASPFSGTRAEMVFRTTFKSQVPPAPPYRVIRFVRAAQVNHLIRRNKEEHTVPGYVCYETVSQQVAPVLDPQAVHTSLTKCFSMAKWSFDGPRQEFETANCRTKTRPEPWPAISRTASWRIS